MVTRFSNSFRVGAKTKVNPLMTVSTRPLGTIVEALFTLYMLCAAWVCRTMKVKLKVISSSLVKRRRKDGGPPAETDSGSYAYCLALSSLHGF